MEAMHVFSPIGGAAAIILRLHPGRWPRDHCPPPARRPERPLAKCTQPPDRASISSRHAVIMGRFSLKSFRRYRNALFDARCTVSILGAART